jgi:hypothetical protein
VHLSRRQLLALTALAGCDDPPAPAPAAAPPATASSAKPRDDRWREMSWPADDRFGEPEMATVLVQKSAPLLVALHGAGEARSLEAGARGWRDDYWIDRAEARLRRPPLTVDDFFGFVRPERLAKLNASLAREPFRGLTLACPYTPRLGDRSVEGSRPFGRFVTEVLLPSVRRELGGTDERSMTGIDGVSMGGRLALLVGFSHPEVFGAVAALQPAISSGEADAPPPPPPRAGGRAPLHIRLVSSDGDGFLEPVRALAAALARRRIPHELEITPGPHDYVWNRGPGAYEMMLWHERVLRGLPPP